MAMSLQGLTAVYTKQSDGSYVAYIAEVEGINTQGSSLREAELNLQDAASMFFAYRRNLAAQQKNSIKKPFALHG